MSVLGFVTGNSSNSRRLSVLVASSWRGIDKQSSTTADDVFQLLSIRQIQELHNEYTLNIQIAKKEIHQLVGSKYRDLIGIAEDIDRMHLMASSLDTEIADISYQKSKFVSFSHPDGASKFALKRRVQNALEARKTTQTLIAKNLITNTLILFDLLLNKSKVSPDVVVFYAKFYHLMETVFQEQFESDPAVNVFYELKLNFRLYLELQLSSYSSSDCKNVERSMELRGLFLHNDVVLSNLEFSQEAYEQRDDFEDDLDDFLQEFVHEDHERANLPNEMNDIYLEQTRTSAYFKSLAPIENYILAYIILNKLNPELNTLRKVLDSFILLRYNFLASLFADISAIANDSKHVNFAKILHFIQDTIEYKDQYFGKDSTRFREMLHACTKPWNLSDVLGFRNWFEQEKIVLNLGVSLDGEDFEVNLSQFGDLLNEFVLVLIREDISNRPVANVTLICRIFLSGIKRLQNSLENETNYSALDLINDQKIPEHIINCTMEKLSKVFESQFNTLVTESQGGSISDQMRSGSRKNQTKSHRLFSRELYSLHEENINIYIKTIRGLSNPHLENAVDGLDVWFEDFNRNISILGLMKTNYFSLSITSLVNKKVNKLRESLQKEYWSRIGRLVSNFRDDFKSGTDLKAWYYTLGIIIQFEKQAFNFDDKENEEFDLKRKEVYVLLEQILSKLVSEIPKSSKDQWDLVIERNKKSRNDDNEALDENEAGIKEVEEEEHFLSRPSFEITSYFYKVASEFLNTSESQKFGEGGIFQQPSIHNVFIGLKDAWLCKIASELDSSTLQGFADVLYILHFVSDEGKIATLKKSATFETKSLETVSKNIEEYFVANEYLFVPLLLRISKSK